MSLNVSSWGGLRPPVTGMPVSKNSTASFSRLLSNTRQDCKRVSTTVLYLRTENTLYSGSLGGTQTVYAEYAPESTEEDPVARIKGNTNDGEFDFICHINDIDPAKASYAEMCALFGHLQKTGKIPPEASSCAGFNVLPCGINTGNVTQRMNYMTAISRMTTSQMFSESNRTAAKILLKMYQGFIDRKKDRMAPLNAGASGFAAQMSQMADTVTISGQAPQEAGRVSQVAGPGVIPPADSIQTKLEKLQKIAEAADYAGMDYEEIYCAIWDRYQKAFGGKMPAITSCLIGGEDWAEINNQFVREVNQAVYDPLFREIADETGLQKGTPEFSEYWKEHYGRRFSAAALGYGGMTAEEREQAVREKYAGRHSLYDFASMMGELSDLGAFSGKMGDSAAFSFLNMVQRELARQYFPDAENGCPSDGEWARVMYQPFDAGKFAQKLRESLKDARFENWGLDIRNVFDNAIDNLLSALA